MKSNEIKKYQVFRQVRNVVSLADSIRKIIQIIGKTFDIKSSLPRTPFAFATFFDFPILQFLHYPANFYYIQSFTFPVSRIVN